MKKGIKFLFIVLGILALCGLGLGLYSNHQKELAQQQNLAITLDENATVKDDYYQAINYDWLSRAIIPETEVSVSVFSDINQENNYRINDIVDAIDSGKIDAEAEGFSNFLTFYEVASDFKQREKDAYTPFENTSGKQVKEMTDLATFFDQTHDNLLANLMLPFNISVGQSLMDTSKKTIELSLPMLILPSPEVYQDEAQKEQYQSFYTDIMVEALGLMGYDNTTASTMVKNALAFDEKIAAYSLSSEEQSVIANFVNEIPLSELEDYSSQFDIKALIRSLLDDESIADEDIIVNVVPEDYYQHIDEIVNEDNFQEMKDWILVNEAYYAGDYLTEDFRQVVGQYQQAIYGQEELVSKEDTVYDATIKTYSAVFSHYYGKTYFSEEARKEVTSIVDHVIAVYKERLEKNDWLSDETKEKAITKLDNMTVMVGYPDEIPEEVELLTVDANQSYFENLLRTTREGRVYSFSHFSDPIEKNQWGMASYDVNAYYSPTDNAIVLPAGILESPFYDVDQTLAQNYGGIGMVIAHEISHAFDDNGAEFDEEGNMKNWWTEADKTAFKEKTNQMVELFDGLPYGTGQVNGRLTVTENTADASGLAAAYDALLDSDPDADLEEFFESYATIWRSSTRLEYLDYILQTDEHAPDQLRVNIQLGNFTPFYDVYDIQEGDGMYIAPEKRVTVW